ncbi:hypothetical protein Pfo_007026, partial [Paulownia fortunei]
MAHSNHQSSSGSISSLPLNPNGPETECEKVPDPGPHPPPPTRTPSPKPMHPHQVAHIQTAWHLDFPAQLPAIAPKSYGYWTARFPVRRGQKPFSAQHVDTQTNPSVSTLHHTFV